MVLAGDADGMVSGATCTTANTIRPALQVRARLLQARAGRPGPRQPPPPPVLFVRLPPPPPTPPHPAPPTCLQLLKTPERTLVSSVFFMCLPERVLVYGDCAVNVEPSSEELSQIAAVSADTAAAFGIEPRVALLSYSTGGSGAGKQASLKAAGRWRG